MSEQVVLAWKYCLGTAVPVVFCGKGQEWGVGDLLGADKPQERAAMGLQQGLWVLPSGRGRGGRQCHN